MNFLRQFFKSRLVFRNVPFYAFFAFFCIANLPLTGQKLRFDHLSVKENLSQGNVWDIYQDKLGFIWVATEDGLNLYDGYDFKVFRNSPVDSFSISANNVDCFAEDQEGNLWIGTQNGLNLYNRKLNRFERFYHDPVDPFSLSNNDIGHLTFDSKGNLWVATVKGLNRLDPTTKRWQKFFHSPEDPHSLRDNVVDVVLEDKDKRIWVATGGGLSLLNPDQHTFTNFYHDESDPTSLSSDKVRALYEDHDGVLWVGTFDAGLNRMDRSTNTFKRYMHDPDDPSSIGNNYIYHLTEDNAGEMWVATDGALNRFNKTDGTFTRYTAVQGDETSLSSDIVSKVMFDRNERMWVGTRFGGLNIYDKGKYGFEHYKYNSYEKNCLSSNNVTDFCEHVNGDFWISTDGGGLNHYNRNTGQFTSYKDLFTNNKVLAIAQDKTENLWAGMWAGGLNYYNHRTKQVKAYVHEPSDPRSLSDNNVFDILISKNGTVWIATWGGGLNKYNPVTNDFTRYTNDPDNAKTISGSPLGVLMEDSSGKIWIGTEQNGFDIFDPTTETFTHFRGGNAPGQLSGNSVFCFLEDSQNRFWIGTNGSGLNLFDPETEQFTTFRENNGLPNDAIMGLVEDPQGYIWISTNKGLSRFDPEKRKFKNYTESDGLQSDQFNRWAYTKLSTGEMLFGGTNGFNLLNIDNIRENDFKPPVYITDFKLFNKPVSVGENGLLRENILLSPAINLQYDQNFFSLEFTALNYRQSEKNKYRYKLEGFDEEWIDAGSERKKEYTNLSPGEYTFRVIASNNDGLWNEQGASLVINIVPPFWKTWWFNTFIGLIAIYSALWYLRYQKRTSKRKQRELEAIISERTGELMKQNEAMAAKAEQERLNVWITEGIATVTAVISRNNQDIDKLGNESLKAIVKYVKAQQGIIALANTDQADDQHLLIRATYGVLRTSLGERIEIGSGLLGETYRDGETKIFENLPSEYLKIESGLGEAQPANIVLLPLKTEDGEIIGVMELAFLGALPEMVYTFLDKISSVLALNIFAASLNQKTTILLRRSKEQTEELRAQEEEMRQNMEELEATTEEFRRREVEYQRRIRELEASLSGKMPTD